MFEREVNPEGATQADVVVGFATYKEADAIAVPARASDEGLVKYFGKEKGALLVCDNASPDDTEGAFLSLPTRNPKIYVSTPKGVAGKGYNFENMFRKALELNARMLLCIDGDIRSITPEWIRHFGSAIDGGYDLATPIYSRHKYDGTITKSICYPTVYGILGHNVRQPIGGDFALSRKLLSYLVTRTWHRAAEEYGVDIFLSTSSILGGFRVAEVGLGRKEHKASAPKLGPMFAQVVETLFLLVTRHFQDWSRNTVLYTPPLFGLRHLGEPQELVVDREKIRGSAVEGFRERGGDLAKFLDAGRMKRVEKMFAAGEPEIDIELWVDLVWDLLAAFAQAEDRPAVVEALRCLYFGRVYSFMGETWEMSTEEAEGVVLEGAKRFRAKRGELIKRLGEVL
ncbi:MAG: glycosyltransferase [Planctomycetota bacterium]